MREIEKPELGHVRRDRVDMIDLYIDAKVARENTLAAKGYLQTIAYDIQDRIENACKIGQSDISLDIKFKSNLDVNVLQTVLIERGFKLFERRTPVLEDSNSISVGLIIKW